MSDMGRDPPRMSKEDVEILDNALTDLRQSVNLAQRDPHRERAAVSLRRAGFSASQIMALSHGNWARQSVERWVAGVAVAPGTLGERAVGIFAEAVDRGLTIDHLLAELSVQATI